MPKVPIEIASAISGWSEQTLRKYVKLKWLNVDHKHYTKMYIDKEELLALRSSHNSYITIHEFAKLAGVSRAVIYKRIGVKGFPIPEHNPNGRKDSLYFSRAEVKAFLNKAHILRTKPRSRHEPNQINTQN